MSTTELLEDAKSILLHCKCLADVVSENIDEPNIEYKIVESARLSAGAANLLLEHARCYVNENPRFPFENKILFTIAKKVQFSILDLIRSSKEVISNPFDFIALQSLEKGFQECSKRVRDFILVIEKISRKEESAEVSHIVDRKDELMEKFRTSLQNIIGHLSDSVQCSKEEFLQSISSLVKEMNSIYEKYPEGSEKLQNIFKLFLTSVRNYRAGEPSISFSILNEHCEKILEELSTLLWEEETKSDPMYRSGVLSHHSESEESGGLEEDLKKSHSRHSQPLTRQPVPAPSIKPTHVLEKSRSSQDLHARNSLEDKTTAAAALQQTLFQQKQRQNKLSQQLPVSGNASIGKSVSQIFMPGTSSSSSSKDSKRTLPSYPTPPLPSQNATPSASTLPLSSASLASSTSTSPPVVPPRPSSSDRIGESLGLGKEKSTASSSAATNPSSPTISSSPSTAVIAPNSPAPEVSVTHRRTIHLNKGGESMSSLHHQIERIQQQKNNAPVRSRPANQPAPPVSSTTSTPSAASATSASPKPAATTSEKAIPISTVTSNLLKELVSGHGWFKTAWEGQSKPAQDAFLQTIENCVQSLSVSGNIQQELDNIISSANDDWQRNLSKAISAASLRQRLGPSKEGKELKDLMDNVKSLVSAVGELIVNANALSLVASFTDKEEKRLQTYSQGLLTFLRQVLLHAVQTSKSANESAGSIKLLEDKITKSTIKLLDEGPTAGKEVDQYIISASMSSKGAANKIASLLKQRICVDSNAIRGMAILVVTLAHCITTKGVTHGLMFNLISGLRSLAQCVFRLLDNVHTSLQVFNNQKDESANPETSSMSNIVNLISTLNEESDVNIWEEKGKPVPRSPGAGAEDDVNGTLNHLVYKLTTHYDNNFLQTFIITYQSFTTPWKLFEKLVQMYNVPKGLGADEKPIRLRVGVVIKYWVENHFYDLDDELVKKLFEFVETRLKVDGYTDLSMVLEKNLTKKLEDRKHHQANFSTEISLLSDTSTPIELFIAMNEEEIARQMTLIDFKLFSSIEPSELLNQSWNRDKLKHRAPNVLAMIGRLNKLTLWVSSMIVWQNKVKERSKLYSKFISLALSLRRLQNFNSLMAVIAGLNMSCVYRLNHTRSLVDAKHMASLNAVEKMMNSEGNYRSYRKTLKAAKVPVIPYLGVYLTDFTFIDDGNPDKVNNLINFKKRELTHRLLQEIQLYQQTGFDFPPIEPLNTFLAECPTSMTEAELYDLSLILEPRNSDISQIS